MRVLDEDDAPRVVLSVSDLTAAVTCEFAVVRALDARLDRIELPAVEPDALLARAAELGDVHEQRVLEGYQAEHPTGPLGPGVVLLPRPTNSIEGLRASALETLDALAASTPVLAQGTVFDGVLTGHPDFLVFEHGAYVVEDAKLAHAAKVPALLQVAAYADMLAVEGVPVAGEARLLLGSGQITRHRLADLVPVYRERRARLEALVAQRLSDDQPARWGDHRYRACGRCDTCTQEVETARDVLLVAGLRASQRVRLHAAGIATIEQLAASTTGVEGISASTLQRLRTQAALQVGQDDRTANGELQVNGWPVVQHVVIDDEPLRRLPPVDDGDVFFDFEGDPLWTEDGHDWGLEYLFGAAEPDGTFHPWWAHDRAMERQALIDFMAWIADRRAGHPRMHIYHYAPYETTALKRLVGRHGVCEEALDDLLRSGVFVDLLTAVRRSVMVSQRSYSLKKLEPMYMAAARDQALDNAADSVAMYAEATALRGAGDWGGAEAVLATIAEYNTYDVLSTHGLRDWLIGLVGRDPVRDSPSGGGPEAAAAEPEAVAPGLRQVSTELAARLGDLAAGLDPTHPDTVALLLVSAALGYHWREDKPMWWEYFSRLDRPLDDLRDDRAVFVPDEVDGGGLPGWTPPTGRKRSYRRTLRLVGPLPEGTEMQAGWKGKTVYGEPLPEVCELGEHAARAVGTTATVVSITPLDDGRSVVVLEEQAPQRTAPWPQVPEALVPDDYVNADPLVRALVELGAEAEQAGSVDIPRAGFDLLRRRPPRTRGPLPPAEGDAVASITSAVRSLDHSYVAVQGPPGTGKTYTGARVVAALVTEGWKVGVVAQSHAVVENLLRECITAGVDPSLIAKLPRNGSTQVAPWGSTEADLAARLASDDGAVIGGTAWTFTKADRVPRGALDLLVVDEAGQFSLANTLAASVAADRLLLLGDPRQLPQVSQGTHPMPVDESALGWLMDNAATMPPALGYFLADTYRMHPRLASVVSRLAYDDRLVSVEPVTTDRTLGGHDPGLTVVRVDHEGNAVASSEEVEAVEGLVRHLLDRPWKPGRGRRSAPLGPDGILVVAPYNAQVNALRRHLADAGLGGVRVGTVDKFQGQEAPVVIVSMTSSSPEEVPRGMGFLLSRNRINVAISRAQWASIVVCSPALTDYLPTSPFALAELGAFLGLSEG